MTESLVVDRSNGRYRWQRILGICFGALGVALLAVGCRPADPPSPGKPATQGESQTADPPSTAGALKETVPASATSTAATTSKTAATGEATATREATPTGEATRGNDPGAVDAARPPHPADPLRESFLAHLVGDVITPAYAELGRAAVRLLASTEGFCRATDPESLQAARTDWRTTMLAWQSIEWLGLGPVRQWRRYDRIRARLGASGSTVGERIGVELARAQPGTVDEAWVAQRPVNMQGLQAIEWLLFSPDSGLVGDATAHAEIHCTLLVAIAANVRTMATDLATAWADVDRRDAIGRGYFVLREKSLFDAFNAVANQIMRLQNDLRHQKLGAPLGIARPLQPAGSTAQPAPASAPAPPAQPESPWSGTSLDNLQANLAALDRLIGSDEEPGLAALLRFAGHPEMTERWRRHLGVVTERVATARSLGAVMVPTQDAAAATEALREGHAAMMMADELFQQAIVSTIGARAVFNFNDGD